MVNPLSGSTKTYTFLILGSNRIPWPDPGVFSSFHGSIIFLLLEVINTGYVLMPELLGMEIYNIRDIGGQLNQMHTDFTKNIKSKGYCMFSPILTFFRVMMV